MTETNYTLDDVTKKLFELGAQELNKFIGIKQEVAFDEMLNAAFNCYMDALFNMLRFIAHVCEGDDREKAKQVVEKIIEIISNSILSSGIMHVKKKDPSA